MRDAPAWRRYLRLFGADPEAEIEDEVRHHIELLIEYYRARGLSPAEARAAAAQKFGDVLRVKSDCTRIAHRRRRAMARAETLDGVIQDVRFGLRSFLRSPVFTAAALLTLGLGIGANTAVFSVVNAVVLQTLPYPESHELMSIWTRYTKESGSEFEYAAISVPEFRDYRAAAGSFSSMSAYRFNRVNLSGGDEPPDRVATVSATAGFFEVMGVKPVLGRAFSPGEDAPGAPCVAVLSDGMWRARFRASTEVLGGTLRLDGQPCTIIGVMPPGFFFPTPEVGIYRPFGLDAVPELAEDRGSHWINAIGRLASGVSRERAESELEPLMAGWRQEHEHHLGHFIVLQPYREVLVGDERAVLLLVLGGVGLVLLIICANLANLLLVRADERRREVAVRVALGARRGRLIRQLLTESLLLAIAGGLIALALAPALLAALTALDPVGLPTFGEPDVLDARVLSFTAGITVLTGALFGSLPALQTSAQRLQETLRSEGRAVTARSRSLTLRRGLVVLEIALCLAVVSAAGLLVRSYQRIQRVDLGFEPEHALVLDVSLPQGDYAEKWRVQRFYEEFRMRVAALPGVHSAGLLSALPLRSTPPNDGFLLEGVPDAQPGEPDIEGGYIMTTPGAFAALGVPVLSGRDFDERDVAGAALVAIVDTTAARRYWPGDNPVGKRIRYHGADSAWLTIVGVVGQVRYESPRQDPSANVYVAHAQLPRWFYEGRDMTLVVRSERETDILLGSILRVAREIDPAVPVTRVASMSEVVASASGRPRMAAGLMSLFGLAALIIGALGIYGILAYVVQARRSEIGLRMALGADAGRLRRDIMSQGMRMAALGMAIGLIVTLGAVRLLSAALGELLFDTGGTDAITFLAVLAVLFATAALASWLPARRATRVDPMTALRN